MAVDPSQNVNVDLLPHVHLISTFRYATMPRVDLQEVTKWLMSAPKIARDTAPFFWTYLDCPPDGSIILTWQPTGRRSVEFASDGYVWSQPEVFYRNDVGNGLILEIYYQRAGYRLGEQFAQHSRRRFRLSPPQVPMQNVPQVDPNLWIVHYGPNEKHERMPANIVPIPPPVQQSMNMRQHLFQLGQIQRKEFMLSDRVNWPTIPFPARGQSFFAAPTQSRGVPQAVAYPPHAAPPVGPTPKRRGGHTQDRAHAPAMSGAQFQVVEGAFDDDEDTSRGDLFDHLSPREVSMARYQQNHEWMEEILSSPYRLGQIVVADLGLGLKGELASLTEGIFEAAGSDAARDGAQKPYTGHLDAGLAEEFRKRVYERNDALGKEIEEMKIQHAKIVAEFKGNAVVKQAELDLRYATQGTGSEFWRLEGRLDDGEEEQARWNQKDNKSLEDIVAQVERVVGKSATVIHEVHRVQDGGYQEPAPEPEPIPQPPQMQQPEPAGTGAIPQPDPMSRQASHTGSHNSGVMIGDSDVDMGGTAAGLLDQIHTGGFSATSTPLNNFPTPQPHQLSAAPSNAATPAHLNVPSPQVSAQQLPTSQPLQRNDVQMHDAPAATTAPNQGTGSGDWVVVPKEGMPAASGRPATTGPPAFTGGGGGLAMSNMPAAMTVSAQVSGAMQQQPVPALAPSSKPASAAPTPGDGLAFDGDNNDFSSLGDLDTAGDALASYDPPGMDGTGGLGDLNMDMEESAFGDAFHSVEHHSGGDTPADGM
ncbi:SWI/SNF and RSC complexes subunit ssr4 [Diplogelasinospora grovesii]|uniref:SWI/SNF and RSC complexes subunit ssr4 n=1 Tax=Diplogelasinospora grovesii TaxID=303347 RepID=A0AAN6NIF8_9PEZI|nr:SWI/SNF and RSC complexes subunit ssr4 [Diplogelasinospora grovesii]